MPVTLPVLTSWRFATVARGCHIVEWPRNRWITSLGNRSTEDSSSSATRAASLRSHSASDDAFKQHNLRPLTLRDRGGHSKSQGFVRFASRSVWSVHWNLVSPLEKAGTGDNATTNVLRHPCRRAIRPVPSDNRAGVFRRVLGPFVRARTTT